jgi:hypothetical protein
MIDKLPVITQPESAPSKPMNLLKRLIIGGGGFILLVGLIGIGVRLFVNHGENRTVNVDSAVKITREFVKALHNRDMLSAYGMLVEESRARQSLDEFTIHLKADANYSAIENYQSLDACGFQFGNSGSITIMGMLYYEGGYVYFESLLSQGYDKVLRIYEFKTISKKPEWGTCN